MMLMLRLINDIFCPSYSRDSFNYTVNVVPHTDVTIYTDVSDVRNIKGLKELYDIKESLRGVAPGVCSSLP